MSSNPRKGSFGYTIRVNAGLPLSNFTGQTGRNITLHVSASAADGFTLDVGNSTLFVGASTIFSSVTGLTMQSGEWCFGQNATATPFATADDYTCWLVASATGQFVISPTAVITVDS